MTAKTSDLKLHMDEGEIIRDYNAAKDKREQVCIMADRNCCSNHYWECNLAYRA